MKIVAILLRVLGLLCVAGTITVWVLYKDKLREKEALLDEQATNVYRILQANQEAKWEELDKDEKAFNATFDADDPVGRNENNPLREALDEIDGREKGSLPALRRNPDYTKNYGGLTKEFGEAGTEPQNIINMKDPHVGKPYKDVTDDSGKVTKGVSRDNRLRTAIGKLYKDRKDKFDDIVSLRSKVVLRDEALRESQNDFNDMKEKKEEFEQKSNELEIELGNTKQDLADEKQGREEDKDGFELRIATLEGVNKTLENEKAKIKEDWELDVQGRDQKHKEEVAQLNRKVSENYNDGFQKGFEEGAETAGVVDATGPNAPKNPFAPPDPTPGVSGTPTPVPDGRTSLPPRQPAGGPVTTLEDPNPYGVVTSIAQLSRGSGMLILPIGSGKGIVPGLLFTVYKAGKPTALIKILRCEDAYSVANILPRFGDPSRLRTGDPVQVVPYRESGS